VLRAAACHKQKLVAGLEKERQRTREELARKLDSWRKEDRAGSWRHHLQVRHSSSQESAGEHARRLLPAMLDDLFRAGRAAARPDANHQKMHRFRLKTKRVRYTLELFEVDDLGLERIDREILRRVAETFSGGPVGLSTLAVAIGEEPDTLEDVYEPYLLQMGLLQRTPRGRVVTKAAYKHLGLTVPDRDPRLF